jgi:hypothetical protein
MFKRPRPARIDDFAKNWTHTQAVSESLTAYSTVTRALLFSVLPFSLTGLHKFTARKEIATHLVGYRGTVTPLSQYSSKTT